jgi:hypothetical protein
MTAPKWITDSGFLGTLTERTAVSVPFTVDGTGTAFSIISGQLPSGLVLQRITTSTTATTTGFIIGNPMNVPATLSSQFVIRAENTYGASDRTFLLDITGGIDPVWVTPSGFLAVGTSGECFAVNEHIVDYQLNALPNVLFETMKLRYYIAEGDGQLPKGLQLTEDGRIAGIIDEITVMEDAATVSGDGYDTEKYDQYPYDSAAIIENISNRPRYIKKIYQFYVTVTDGFNSSRKLFKLQVVDVNSLRADTGYISADARCFQAGDSYLYAPAWLSPANLGIRRASNYQIVRIQTYDPHPELGTVEWDWGIVSVNPEVKAIADTQYNTGPSGVEVTIRGIVDTFSELPYPANIGDLFNVIDITKSYVWNGSDWEYADFLPKYNRAGTSTVHVKNLSSLPQVGQQFRLDTYVDDAIFTTTYIVSSVTGTTALCQLGIKHSPVEVNGSTIYDTTLKDDIPDNTIFYIGSAVTKPPGFSLNSSSGDLYGQIPYIPAYSLDYKFTIRMTKTDQTNGTKTKSDRVFQLRLQGSINTDLAWLTTSTVGVIRAGYQSELHVLAQHENFPELGIQYKLVDGELPNGLEFKVDGSIVGKVPYGGTTEIDYYDTNDFSIDGDQTTFDRSYSFTVEATNAYRLATIDKEFSILIGDNSPTPFSSVYVRPFMARNRRRTYRDFINNTDIFDSNVLYRPADPAFGIQREIKMVLEYGLERLNLAEYVTSLQNYFYNKRFYFGDIKTIPAEDENGTHVYDLVYVDIIDSQLSTLGKSPDNISFLINQNLVDVYSNSLENWQSSLEGIQIYGNTIQVDEYLRPRFMRTIQSNTGAPLGFIKAVPVCYTQPGEGYKVMRKIQLSGFDFKMIDFEVDRLIIDQTMDYTGDKYLKFPIKNIDSARPLNVLAGPDGVIITDENGTELLVE